MLLPVVDSMMHNINKRTAGQVNSETSSTGGGADFMLDFNHWIQEFQALSTIALLSGAQIDSPPELSTHLGPLKE